MPTERLTHSFKTALAVCLGFLLTRVVPLPADQWVIITILVVMCAQLYVGSVLQKSLLRFLGTLVGCLFALACLMLLPLNPYTLGLALVFSSFCFSFLATSQENLGYAGTLGAVTVPIILLGQHPTAFFAVSRFLEISVGLLIATLVSQFILPIHARSHLRRAQVATVNQLIDYYRETIVNTTADVPHEERDEAIVKSILKQRSLAKESVREPLGKRFDPEHFADALYCEREILRAITFMHLAQTHLPNHSAFTFPALTQFHDDVLSTLTAIAEAIQKNSPLPALTLPSIHALQKAWPACERTDTDALYLDGYLFNAEILAGNCQRLVSMHSG